MKNIIVLCTGNSFRSQMAEGYLRRFSEGRAVVYSAGVRAIGMVTDKAIRLMEEDGIDISFHTSNQVDEYFGIDFDFVITVCDHAHETCPIFPGKVGKNIHQSFPDPEKKEGQSEEDYFESLRPVRDSIRFWCEEFVKEKV